jgi:putative SOS response-associated peptidase YedK
MCGRFTYNLTWEQIYRLYQLTLNSSNLRPNFNVCPTTTIDVAVRGDDPPSRTWFVGECPICSAANNTADIFVRKDSGEPLQNAACRAPVNSFRHASW